MTIHYLVALGLHHAPCGVRNASQLTADPEKVTCARCKSTLTNANPEVRAHRTDILATATVSVWNGETVKAIPARLAVEASELLAAAREVIGHGCWASLSGNKKLADDLRKLAAVVARAESK